MEYGNREELTVADPEFRRLHEEHRHHEERLHAAGGQVPPLRRRGVGREASQEGKASPEGPHGSDRPPPPRGGRPLRIPIAREGWAFILPALAAGALSALCRAGPPRRSSTRLDRSSCSSSFAIPERTPEGGADTLVSPADGTVLSDHRSARSAARRPAPALDLHVGLQLPRQPRARRPAGSATTPTSAGARMAAFADKASIENEQNRITLASARRPGDLQADRRARSRGASCSTPASATSSGAASASG